MSDSAPTWLITARVLTGTHEVSGAGDNPTILSWGSAIARKFPEMASYTREYTHDSIAWCGYFLGYCFAVNGIRPPFGPADTDRFMWAAAWANWGTRVSQPQLGDVLVLNHHVTLYNGRDGDYYLGLGGNQSDSVNVQRYHPTNVLTIRRPPAPERLPDAPTIPEKPKMPTPDYSATLATLAESVLALAKQVEEIKQAKPPSAFSQVVTNSPFLGIAGLVLQVLLTVNDVMGPVGAGGTATANTTTAGLLGVIAAGILNWFKPKEPAK